VIGEMIVVEGVIATEVEEGTVAIGGEGAITAMGEMIGTVETPIGIGMLVTVGTEMMTEVEMETARKRDKVLFAQTLGGRRTTRSQMCLIGCEILWKSPGLLHQYLPRSCLQCLKWAALHQDPFRTQVHAQL